jgi:hypothetical protein
MAQQDVPPPPPQTLELTAQPGIQRDGTAFSGKRWTDGQWVRFQRGKPKKVGGYRAMVANATGPIRKVLIDARSGAYTAHTFSPWGVERFAFDPNTGAGGGISIRTPGGLAYNANYNWSADKMTNVGGTATNLLALSAVDLDNINNDGVGTLYSGDITGTGVLTTVYSDVAGTIPVQASGDVVALPPFVFVTGSNGLIQNSNPNNISGPANGWVNSTGANVYANLAYVAGTKVVKGLPLRGGSLSPAGLFWALDSLIRVSFQSSSTGYFNYWRYDTISGRMSVLSKNSIIEYDGLYFWAGVDRFFMYNGVIQELPNDTNLNFFFDNINMTNRQRVFAAKVPRYGEIWWFFPKGQGQVECNAAVIYNIRENCWYDAQLMRTSGMEADIFPNPILCGGENSVTGQRVPYTVGVGSFALNQLVTGTTSGATGIVARITAEPALDLTNVVGVFQNAETIHNVGSTATGTTATGTFPAQSREIDVVWEHEAGTDKVLNAQQTPILSYITSPYFSYAGGMGGMQNPQGYSILTRLLRVEPDFTSVGALGRTTGAMTMTVNGVSYPNAAAGTPVTYAFDSTTPFFDTRAQFREMTLTFTSNTFNGFYELGRILLTMEPGDGRP